MQNMTAVGQTATFASSAVPAARPGAAYNVGWERLTNDDWDLLSAVAGKPIGPNAPGFQSGNTPLMPLAGVDMIAARRNGTVAPGENIPAEVFKAQLGGQPPEMREQLERAIAYATQRDAARARFGSAYLDSAAGRVDLYG
jgi:hypothetical protein